MRSDAEDTKRVRPNLRCLNLETKSWSKLKELSKIEQRSISSYIRYLADKEYKKVVKSDTLTLAG